jgi:hypothetical protein
MATLEAALTALTQEFVARLVDAIRNASFAEVATLSLPAAGAARAPRASRPQVSTPRPSRGRQTAAGRAELGEQLVGVLRKAAQPMGVRALSSELGVPADKLAVPLRELRAAGKVRKHGEKRSTTYSAA